MRLLIASHKLLHTDTTAASGHSTTGGFSAQTAALAGLADECVLCAPVGGPADSGMTAIDEAIAVHPLRWPGAGWRRRAALPGWTWCLWKEVRTADLVHAPVPGDVGFLAILVTVLARKPLFVRHCATWRSPASRADRVLKRLLVRLADGPAVVLATGADPEPPSPGHNVRWIFSTSIRRADLDEVRERPGRTLGDARSGLVLVSGGRLIASKGTDRAIEAFAVLHERAIAAHMHVIGDGPSRCDLEDLARRLGVDGSVTFHGQLSRIEVLDVFDRCDLLVYPTCSNEGFPKLVLEALSRQLPVVATPVSAIPTLVGHAGKMVEPDVEAVAAGVEALTRTPGGLDLLRRRALDRAEGYTLEAWIEEIGGHLAAAWGSDRVNTTQLRPTDGGTGVRSGGRATQPVEDTVPPEATAD